MSDVLVAYFSAIGVTAGVAERLAESVGANMQKLAPGAKVLDGKR